MRVCIVGAGVVGLSTAHRLVEVLNLGQEPGQDSETEIVIIAEKFYNETTTYGCGGLWEPYQISGTSDEKINEWGQFAFKHFLDIYYGPDVQEAGIKLMPAFSLFKETDNQASPAWKDITLNFKRITKEELVEMHVPSQYVGGFTFQTLVIDQKYYMKYITKRLKASGVKFVQKKIDNITELHNDAFDVIINCTGLGAYGLVKDTSMYPIRGQVIRIKAPWIQSIWFYGSSYLIPNMDNCIVGGTAERGEWDTTVNVELTEKLIKDASELFPSINTSLIETVWVGLRPGRTPLRLDSEIIKRKTTGKDILQIHCYGHGGSGVTIGMGCAEDVIKNHLLPWLRKTRHSRL